MRRVDDERHTQRFTPRKPASNWSAVNVAKVEALRAAGRMRPAGEAAFARRRPTAPASTRSSSPPSRSSRPSSVPGSTPTPAAWAFFEAQPPCYRQQAIWWVISAKKPETRERRLALLIADSAAGERIKPLRPPQPKG